MAPDGTFTITSSDASLSGYDTFTYRPVVGGWGLPTLVYLWPTEPLDAPTAAPSVDATADAPVVSWAYRRTPRPPGRSSPRATTG